MDRKPEREVHAKVRDIKKMMKKRKMIILIG